MSLINDALRRADTEKRQREAGAEPPTPPPLPPEETDPPAPKRRSPWTVLLGVALLVLVGVVVCGLWWGIGEVREKAGAAVESASAAFDQAVARSATSAAGPKTASPPGEPVGEASPDPAADTADETTDPPDVETHPVAPADGHATASPACEVPATAAAEAPGSRLTDSDATPPADASATTDGWPDLRQPAAVTASALPGGPGAEGTPMAEMFNRMLGVLQTAAPNAADGQEAARTAEGASTATLFGDVPAAAGGTPPVDGGGPPVAGGAPATGRTESAKAEADASGKATVKPELPSPPLPPVDTSNLKISSIMVGPKGGLAIINGRPVRVGETIAGAKVVSISSRTVEVEIDGRHATVGM